jgi:photosystem II stability/assembly factor-like uncharacterized protein
MARDVLDTSSLPSALVADRLLTDITWAGNRMVAVGERGHIIYSDDEGKSWTQAKVPVSVLLTAVYFVSPKKGWAVGHGAVVLNTTDGGNTWRKQFDGVQANQEVLKSTQTEVNNLKAQLAAAPDDQKNDIENKLEDAKYALQDAQSDVKTGPAKPLLDVWFKNDKEGFVVGAYGLFFKTNDGGNTWKNYALRLNNPNGYHLNGITQITGGSVFIDGEAGTVYRSDDLGETWKTVTSPYEGSLFGISSTGRANELIVFGLRGNLFRSEDLGNTWKKIDTGEDNSLNSAYVGKNGAITVVGNSGVVLTSKDYAATFTTVFRTDRLAVMAALQTKNDNLVLVGENGVTLADPTGKDL